MLCIVDSMFILYVFWSDFSVAELYQHLNCGEKIFLFPDSYTGQEAMSTEFNADFQSFCKVIVLSMNPSTK